MKFSQRMIALALIVVIIVPVCFTSTVADRRLNSVLGRIRLVDALLDSSEPIMPSRPYITEEEYYGRMEPLKRYLASREISFYTFISDETLKDKVMGAKSLRELAPGRTELEGLKRLMDEAQALLDEKTSPGDFYDMYGFEQKDLLTVATKLKELFRPDLALYVPNSDSAMKGTWTSDNRILLKWTPVDGWIPEAGYNLFRVVNGNAELIGEGLGSIERTERLLLDNPDYADYVEVFRAATLDAEKKAILGVGSEREFHSKAYAEAHSYESYQRWTGDTKFQDQLDLLMLLKEDKMPFADSFRNVGLHFKNDIHTATTAYEDYKESQGLHPVVPEDLSYMPPILSAEERVEKELLEARKAILTKAFIDSRFANDMGLGYDDVLGDTRYDTNTPVRYVLVPLDGTVGEANTAIIASGEDIEGSFSVTVPYGVELPIAAPTGFMGYGADNRVFLRWDAATDGLQKKLVSGYYVERRKKPDSVFTRASDLPVAVTYSQDIEGFLLESPSMFEDQDVNNGDEFVYRVQAVDIFGRISAYTPELEVTVYKYAPPETPSLAEPTITAKISGRTPETHNQLAMINSGTNGVILPIHVKSPDTRAVIVYRSKANGNSHFGPPTEVARINYMPFTSVIEPVYSLTPTGSIFSIRPAGSGDCDILYYDSDIEQGYYYKYWVSAIDSYNNESDWSPSEVVGISGGNMLQIPARATAEMRHNQIVSDREPNPPGFRGRYVMEGDVQRTLDLDFSAQIDMSGLEGGQQNGASPGYSAGQISGPEGSGFVREITAVTGLSLSDAVRQDPPSLPTRLSLEDDNLPNLNDIQDIIALTGDDLEADGSARFNWYHYGGTGLKGYTVYRAYADGLPAQALQNMSQAEILESFDWTLITANTQVNGLVDRVERSPGRIYLYLVCLIPDRPATKFLDAFSAYIPAGWVRVDWERPDDPQVSYFRVYRAEVQRFEDGQDLSSLDWQLVSDNTKTTAYSEKVDQTDAHYYIYKITSVSIWGVESQEGAIVKYRVPATVAPQAPTMLVPFSRMGVNEINWLGVPHATRYVVFRAEIPVVDAEDLRNVINDYPYLSDRMFGADKYQDVYRPNEAITNSMNTRTAPGGALPAWNVLASTSGLVQAAGGFQLSDSKPGAEMISRFKTGEIDALQFSSSISGISMAEKASAVQDVLDKYGVLAIAPYSSLSKELAATVAWEKAGEVAVMPGEDPTGEKSFLDHTAKISKTYYYTVQALNDDNLGSDMPEPVTLFTRMGEAFSSVNITAWSNDGGHPRIYWDSPRHPDLTVAGCQKLVAGYLVYRSNRENGEYYQVSPLISWNTMYFTDMEASVEDENWYRVKVLNTAGYISDFSEPVRATDSGGAMPEDAFSQVTGMKDGYLRDYTNITADARTPWPSRHTTGRLDTIASLRTPTPTPIVIPTPTPGVIPTPTPGVIPTPTPTVIPIPTPTPGATTPPPGSDSDVPMPTPSASPTPPPYQTATPTPPPFETVTPTPPPYQQATPTPIPYTQSPEPGVGYSDTMYINDFTIRNVSPETWSSGKGTGNLMLLEYPVRVSINAEAMDGAVITRGSVTMLDASILGDTGVHLTNLSVRTSDRVGARAGGYVKGASGSLMGDLEKLRFNNSLLTSNGFIEITEVPVFHYQNLTFISVDKVTVDFGKLNRDGMVMPFLKLSSGMVENSLGLEYFNANIEIHRGLQYTFSMVAFNKNGQLNGSFRLDGTQKMRIVVPAGLMIKATDSFLDYRQGQVNASASYIEGRILTIYETWTDDWPGGGDQGGSAETHSLGQEDLESLLNSSGASNEALVDSALYFIVQGAQSNALHLFPDDPAQEEAVSSLPFSVSGWDGGGFVVSDTVMTPANIPLFDPSRLTWEQQAEQRNAMLGITPGNVALDLSRDKVYDGASHADTKDPAWMGIVVKNGNVSLPPSFVKAQDGNRIRFDITPGELLYDLNGFCYQNQAYSPEGREADLGEDLGGFTNLIIRNIVIDLYANNADVLVEADLGVDLFQRYVRIQMLRDDHSGMFVCNVLESEQFDVAGNGKVMVRLSGGYLDKKGMHLDGFLSMNITSGSEGGFVVSDIGFNGLTVPPAPKKIPGRVLGRDDYAFTSVAMLTKPYIVKFHDFPMEIRSLTLSAEPLTSGRQPGGVQQGYTGMKYSADITFFGGMQLSDTIELNTDEDLDRIMFTGVLNDPAIEYESCKTQLNMEFEDFTQVRGVGAPVAPPPGSDTGAFIEYDTGAMEMMFTPSNAISFDSAFRVKARFGYDKIRKRYYFAVASYYTGSAIPFGYGEIFNMAGMFAYNMEMKKNPDGTFVIPREEQALFAMVPDMKPDVSAGGNYVFAAAVDMTLRFFGYKFGELRNMYLLVEKGPSVELGGQFWAATDIDSLISQTGFEPVGEARIGYYSARKLFKTSLTLLGQNFCGFSVSGEISFETCPDYWQLLVGYPDYLAAKLGSLYAGLGLGIRVSGVDESFFMVKAKAGFDASASIKIVYVRGFLEFGGEGGISDDCLWLMAYVRGGVSGGVNALGKKYDVISLTLDASGTLVKYRNRGWHLGARTTISYHVDLVLDDIDGSVEWHIKMDL